MSCKVLFVGPSTTNPPWGELSPGKNLTTQRAEVPSLYYKIHDCRAELCPAVPVPPSWRWGSAAAGFPHSQDTTSLCSSLWIPLNCCYHCAASTEWAKPRNCLLEKPNTTREGGKKNFKKIINHTLDTVITMRSRMSCFTSTLQTISQAGK